jgi:hypothetical protein
VLTLMQTSYSHADTKMPEFFQWSTKFITQ